MRSAGVALAVVLASCAPITSEDTSPGNGGAAGNNGGGAGGSGGGVGGVGTMPRPIPGQDGGATASGCNGVTARGNCEIDDSGQKAIVCDVADNQLVTTDCTAAMQVCVLDAQRGAVCETLPPPPRVDMARPPDMARPSDMAHAPLADLAHEADMTTLDLATPPDLATPACASGVDYHGYCAATTAIWCDPSTGETIVINCADYGQACEEDVCTYGAYCCDTDDMSI